MMATQGYNGEANVATQGYGNWKTVGGFGTEGIVVTITKDINLEVEL